MTRFPKKHKHYVFNTFDVKCDAFVGINFVKEIKTFKAFIALVGMGPKVLCFNHCIEIQFSCCNVLLAIRLQILHTYEFISTNYYKEIYAWNIIDPR